MALISCPLFEIFKSVLIWLKTRSIDVCSVLTGTPIVRPDVVDLYPKLAALVVLWVRSDVPP